MGLKIIIIIIILIYSSIPYKNLRARGAENLIKKLIFIIDNFCIALFSGAHKLIALYNILLHFSKLGKKKNAHKACKHFRVANLSARIAVSLVYFNCVL